MTKIGITGGIGSGKSVISRILKIMHYPVYDSDYWAKFLMNNDKTIYKALTDKFGPETYSSEGINRPFLAQLIFNNKENLTFVNSIVHPAVGNHFGGHAVGGDHIRLEWDTEFGKRCSCCCAAALRCLRGWKGLEGENKTPAKCDCVTSSLVARRARSVRNGRPLGFSSPIG